MANVTERQATELQPHIEDVETAIRRNERQYAAGVIEDFRAALKGCYSHHQRMLKCFEWKLMYINTR